MHRDGTIPTACRYGRMKYRLGQNGYWAAPAMLAQHLTDIGSVSACNRGLLCPLVIAACSKLQGMPDHPANTIHSPNAGLMLARRLRLQSNISPVFVQCIVFAGQLLFPANIVHMFCAYWVEHGQQTRGVEPVLV